MKTQTIVSLFLLSALLLGSTSLAQGGKNLSRGNQNPDQVLELTESFFISESEIEGLKMMREEEKLARDVYLALYEKWNLPIFSNIARSEQSHTNAVQSLLKKYDIPDPVGTDVQGVFVNQNLQDLYNSLVFEGSESVLAALEVGATIEDLDISDLRTLSSQTQNPDILRVYGELEKGSRNHIRSFNRQLLQYGGEAYSSKYISQESLLEILSTAQERGSSMNENESTHQGNSMRGSEQNRGRGQNRTSRASVNAEYGQNTATSSKNSKRQFQNAFDGQALEKSRNFYHFFARFFR
jgi:hypothetical protein